MRARPRTGGGFDLNLPDSYSPSRHDRKLAEVATSEVGIDGWYVDVDPRTLTASIIPAEPPTFPAVLPSPCASSAAAIRPSCGWAERCPRPGVPSFRPILQVVDEASGLLLPDRTPAGIPKDHPLAVEAAQANLLKAALASSINKIIAELRFVGVRMLLASQVTNNSTGIGPSLKSKMGHKILQGANPSRTARTQVFSDESAVPLVPGNVRADPDAAKGTGVAELEGSEPVVYTAYYATTGDYAAALNRLDLGVPTTDAPAPTAVQIARHSPVL